MKTEKLFLNLYIYDFQPHSEPFFAGNNVCRNGMLKLLRLKKTKSARASLCFFCAYAPEALCEEAPLKRLLLFVHIDGCAAGESLAVSFVELREVHFAHADAKSDGHEGSEQFTVLAWTERRRRQQVHSAERQFVGSAFEADFPDEFVRCPQPEPRAQDISDAEAFVLPCEETPRALQPEPELYEAFLSVFDGNHTSLLNLRLYSAVLQKRPQASS